MKIMRDTVEKLRIQLPHRTVEINHQVVGGAVENGSEWMPFLISFFQDGPDVSAMISCGNGKYHSRWVDYRVGELLVSHLNQVNVPESLKGLLTSRLDQFLAGVNEEMKAAGAPAGIGHPPKKGALQTFACWFLGGDR